MATKVFTGNAQAVAQVETLTLALTWALNDTATVEINSKSITVTAASGTKSAIALQIANAWNSSTIPEFTEITAAQSGDTVVLTGDTAGLPFDVSVSSSTAGDGTFAGTTTTAATGPNHFGNADNWADGSAPVNNDSVVCTNSAVSILFDLDQSSLDLTSLETTESYKGTIGLPRTNAAKGYVEYRDTYLSLSTATTVNLRATSSRLKLNLGTNASTVNVDSAGTPTDDVPAILLQGSHASNVLNVTKGSVGVAFFAGETAQFPSLKVRYKTNIQGDAKVKLGSGCSLTTVDVSGGQVEINSNVTTLNSNAGETTLMAGTPGTVNALGGKVVYRTAGTCTTMLIAGEVDCRQDARARIWTNTTVRKGAKLFDPNKTITFTNPVAFQADPFAECEIRLGSSLNLQRS